MPGAAITETAPIHQILDHLGEPHEPPSIRPEDHQTGSTLVGRPSWMKISIRTATRLTNLQTEDLHSRRLPIQVAHRDVRHEFHQRLSW
jgi:hypothetical protein